MKADPTTLISFLCKDEITLEIPVYQRNYAWSESNCNKLWIDITKLIKLRQDSTDYHFLGTLVAVEEEDNTKGHTTYTIIDGQQRLTTLSLLLLAMLNLYKKNNSLLSIPSSDKLQYFLTNRYKHDDTKIKLKTVKNDRHVYDQLFDNEDTVENKQAKLYHNYKFFKARLQQFTTHYKNFEPLLDAINNLKIILITLTPQEKPQEIFESINGTGVALTTADLIRNYLLMNLINHEQADIYKKYWKPIENNTEIPTDKEILSDTPKFIKNYLSCIKSTNIKYDDILDNFKEIFKNEVIINNPEQLEKLTRYSGYYKTLLKPQYPNEIINRLIRTVSSIEATRVLLLEIIADYETTKTYIINEAELINTLKILASFIIRNAIVKKANGLNNKYPPLHNRILKYKEQGNKSSYSEILGQLLRNNFISNARLQYDIPSINMYDLKKYILNILQILDHQWNNNISVNYDPKHIQVEHIMPRSTKNWQHINKDEHNQYVDTLGNLTITNVNSKAGDKSFTEKKEIYKIPNDSGSYTNLYKEINANTDWSIENIKARTERLIKELIEVLPFPKEINLEVKNTSNTLDKINDLNYNKILSFEIFNHKENTETARDFFHKLVSWLYKQDEYKNLLIPDRFSWLSSTKINADYREIAGSSYYVNTHASNNRKLELIKKMFEELEIPLNALLITNQDSTGDDVDDEEDDNEYED